MHVYKCYLSRTITLNKGFLNKDADKIYCRVPTRWGLLQTTNKPPWAPGSDKAQGQGSFGSFTGGLDLRGASIPKHD